MTTKKRDEELYYKWKAEVERTGEHANEHWEPLVQSVAVPAARAFVAKFGGKVDIPKQTIHTHALRNAMQGILQWDPSHEKGANLFSFVQRTTNQGSGRFVQTSQNPGNRVPEHRGYSARSEFEAAKERFEGEHNYVPSQKELGDYILGNREDYPQLGKLMNKGNAVDYVHRFENDITQGAPGTAEVLVHGVSKQIDPNDSALMEVKYKLRTGLQKDEEALKVLEMKMEGVSGNEIAKRLGISASKVSIISNRVIGMIQQEQGRRRS